MYPPPNQPYQQPYQQPYPTPSPFGGPQHSGVPVPASATVLFICGILKMLTAIGAIIAGVLFLLGGAAFGAAVSDGRSSGSDLVGGLGMLFAGGAGVLLLCVGSAIFASALLDTIGGHLARKGRASGRVLGIISAVFGLLSAFGSLGGPLAGAGSSSEQAAGGIAGGLFGFLIVGGINLYLLVSFLRNGEAFKG